MKTIIITVCSICTLSLCSAQETATAVKASATAAFQWSATTYDFGKTKVGVPVSYEFSFKNTGMVPLIISSAKVSCDCTVTAFTRDPVPYGASGFVRVTYDGSKTGVYSKTVVISANTVEGVVNLTIKGEIVD